MNSIVTVRKINSDKVRICIDPRYLNDAIEREHFSMQKIEVVVTRISGAKVFSTLDANAGYWQMRLDDASADLGTFNSSSGRYRYKRMPFGIKSAPEIFQSGNG